MPTEPPLPSELVSFYSSLRDYQAAYHNHKEMLGWLGIAAYLVGTVQVALSSLRGIGPTVAVVVTTVVVLAYVRRQFNLRLYSAEVVRASARLAALALAGVDCDDQLAPKDIEEVDERSQRGKLAGMVRIVFPGRHNVAEINLDVLPHTVVAEMTEIKKKRDRKYERRAESLETGTYILVSVVGIATVLVLMLR
jgi:hypothetical protein